MENIRENLSSWITELSLRSGVLRILIHIIDIFVLSVLLFICVKFLASIMRKRSGRLLVGIFAVLLLVLVSYLFNLQATFFVLESVMQFGLIAVVVIFQPEIRTLLENVGYASKKLGSKTLFISKTEKKDIVENICGAVKNMALHKVGALIVFQREKEINAYDELKSVNINSDISGELIENIFFKNSPLHDGAVIISEFRIAKARVLFDKISNNPNLALDLGSRHKAGVGATEGGSDSIAVMVSEETGNISYAIDGEIRQNVSAEELARFLRRELVVASDIGKDQGKGRNKEKAAGAGR